MNTPVEKIPGAKSGVRSFTKAAVQRAMDRQAAKWGAPHGYYHVECRAGVMNRFAQVWVVKVRLFGGSVPHYEYILFGKDSIGEVPQYRQRYATFLKQGGKRIELFKLDSRYETTSLEAVYVGEAIENGGGSK